MTFFRSLVATYGQLRVFLVAGVALLMLAGLVILVAPSNEPENGGGDGSRNRGSGGSGDREDNASGDGGGRSTTVAASSPETTTIQNSPSPEETSGQTIDYQVVQDDVGALRLEVPSDWDDVATDANLTVNDKQVGDVGLVAAPNIDRYYDGYEGSGVVLVLSRRLAKQYPHSTVNQVLDLSIFDYSGVCEKKGRYHYDDGAPWWSQEGGGLQGQHDVWTDCDGTGNKLHTLAATPTTPGAGPPYVVIVQFVIAGETQPGYGEVEEHVLNTLDVVHELVPSK